MTGSPFKEGLRSLEPGDRVTVQGPLGHLLYDPQRPAVMVAGGIGVTPFRGMIRYATDRGFGQPIRLVYSARVPEEFAFKSELDALATKHPDLRIHYTVTRPGTSSVPWAGPTGRIAEQTIRDATQGLDDPTFYVVGLPEMVRATSVLLETELRVPEHRIRWEPFHGY